MSKPDSMWRMLKFFLPIILLICCSAQASSQDQPLVVFLVRHAEKVDERSRNPELSAVGKKRAVALVNALKDAEIKHVHSTDFIRTMKTAAPVAKKGGLKVDLYGVRDLPGFVERLKSTGGRHLIVGHSNTTPKLVKLLEGDPGGRIDEKEYDRLYIVTIGKDSVSTVLVRYGVPYVPKPGK